MFDSPAPTGYEVDTVGWAGNVVSPKRRKNRCDRCWAYQWRRAKSGLQRRLRFPSGMANSFALGGDSIRVLFPLTFGNKICRPNEQGRRRFPAHRSGGLESPCPGEAGISRPPRRTCRLGAKLPRSAAGCRRVVTQLTKSQILDLCGFLLAPL